jgi:type I restriction enzyme S subunit
VAFINPTVTFDKLDAKSEISFIPMEVINEHTGAIEELRSKKVSESKGFPRLQEGDLIWAKITPCMQNGKSAVARNLKQGFACGSTEFYVIRPKSKKVVVEYLHYLLRDKRVLETAQNFFGGSAGQQRVSIEFLKDFQIPLPPLETQNEIAAHIQSVREQAQRLEAEAKATVEEAKTEVERMILGA